MPKGGKKHLIFHVAKIQKIFQSLQFWTTFLLLKNIKSLAFRDLKNRFGKLYFIEVSQND